MKVATKLLAALGVAAMTVSACFGAVANYTLSGNPGNGASGNNLSGTVNFTSTGNTLTIVLTNTSTLGTGNTQFTDTDLLQGLFFGNQALAYTPTSAISSTVPLDIMNSNSSGANGGCQPPSLCMSNDVGAGWNGSATPIAGYANTIRSAGYGIAGPFGDCTQANGCSNFPNPTSPTNYYLDGANYGILPSGFPASQTTYSPGAFSIQPTIVSLGSVTFTLTNVQAFADDASLAAAIGDIRLQFGRDLTSSFVTVPEPIFYSLVSLGGIALLLARRARSRQAA